MINIRENNQTSLYENTNQRNNSWKNGLLKKFIYIGLIFSVCLFMVYNFLTSRSNNYTSDNTTEKSIKGSLTNEEILLIKSIIKEYNPNKNNVNINMERTESTEQKNVSGESVKEEESVTNNNDKDGKNIYTEKIETVENETAGINTKGESEKKSVNSLEIHYNVFEEIYKDNNTTKSKYNTIQFHVTPRGMIHNLRHNFVRETGNNKIINSNTKNIYGGDTVHVDMMFDMVKYIAKFFNFKRTYDKFYKDIYDQNIHFENFKANYQKIQMHNKMKNKLYEKKINKFADYSEKDLKSMFKKLLPVPHELKKKYVTKFSDHLKTINPDLEHVSSKNNFKRYGNSVFDIYPENLDYRKEGIVHEIKDQGSCGSCWAFASIGNIESIYAKNNNKTMLTLSEQEVVDCSKLNFGCDGGHPLFSFIYGVEKGICLNQDYMYKAMDNLFCLRYGCSQKVNLTSIGAVDSDELIIALNEVGPVSVNVGVDLDFLFYSRGIFDGQCTDELNHSVLLVGYGQVKKNQLWDNMDTHVNSEEFYETYDQHTNCDGYSDHTNKHTTNAYDITKNSKKNSTGDNEDDTIYYWIIKNSWSRDWGENGFMRLIKIKTNQIKIKTNQIKIKTNQIKIKTNPIKIKPNQIKIKTNHIKIKTNQIKIKTNQIKIKTNQIKINKGTDGRMNE
ncbi:cysteine proteinase falcipain 1 [Hepatocystis sp. ex Piliocolobus tephrosceles]|nr:cysteine proteinase falcipain 1 [Hepatocystis sp. ex Piliocolobus tephrosceles]